MTNMGDSPARRFDDDGEPTEHFIAEISSAVASNIRVRAHTDSYRRGYEDREKRIGKAVREVRIESGRSQEELAHALKFSGIEVHQSTIAKIEAGTRPLRVSEALAIADALDLPWYALMDVGREVDLRPEEHNLPIDELEMILESLLQGREETREGLLYELEQRALSLAEADARIILTAAAMRKAAAEVALADRSGLLDEDAVQGHLKRWQREAAQGSESRRRRENISAEAMARWQAAADEARAKSEVDEEIYIRRRMAEYDARDRKREGNSSKRDAEA